MSEEYPVPQSAEAMVATLIQRGYTREEVLALYQKKYKSYLSDDRLIKLTSDRLGSTVMSNCMREMPKKPKIVSVKFIHLGKGQTFTSNDPNENRLYTSFIISDIDVEKKKVSTKVLSAEADRKVDYITFLTNAFHSFVMYDGKLAVKEDGNYYFTKECEVYNPQPLKQLDPDPFVSVEMQLKELGIPKMTVTQASTYRSKVKGGKKPQVDNTDIIAVFGQFASRTKIISTKMVDYNKVPVSMGLINIVDEYTDRTEKRDVNGKTIYPGLGAKVDPSLIRDLSLEGEFCFIGSMGEYEHKPSMNCCSILTIFSPQERPITEE